MSSVSDSSLLCSMPRHRLLPRSVSMECAKIIIKEVSEYYHSQLHPKPQTPSHGSSANTAKNALAPSPSTDAVAALKSSLDALKLSASAASSPSPSPSAALNSSILSLSEAEFLHVVSTFLAEYPFSVESSNLDFSNQLNPSQRAAIHSVAEKLSLIHQSYGHGASRMLNIAKPIIHCIQPQLAKSTAANSSQFTAKAAPAGNCSTLSSSSISSSNSEESVILYDELIFREGSFYLEGIFVDYAAISGLNVLPTDYRNKRIERDGIRFHITLLPRHCLDPLRVSPQWTSKSSLDFDSYIFEQFANVANDWVDAGFGMVKDEQQENAAFYRVVKWPAVEALRKILLPEERQNLHITMGFKKSDIHHLIKDESTILDDIAPDDIITSKIKLDEKEEQAKFEGAAVVGESKTPPKLSSPKSVSSPKQIAAAKSSFKQLDLTETEETRAFDEELKVCSVGPYRMRGKVVHGFGRGSRFLGCPTANLDPSAFESVLSGAPRGVYGGWAQIDDGEVYPAVLSLGLNPTFDTEKETVEAFILHQFHEDFYDRSMALLICGYLRPSIKFASFEDLMKAIARDARVGKKALTQDEQFKHYQNDVLFKQPRSDSAAN